MSQTLIPSAPFNSQLNAGPVSGDLPPLARRFPFSDRARLMTGPMCPSSLATRWLLNLSKKDSISQCGADAGDGIIRILSCLALLLYFFTSPFRVISVCAIT
jgi:hypothetical protein